MSNLKNVNLEVANFAMMCVEEVNKPEEKNCKDKRKETNKRKIDSKEYKRLVKKMSALIQKNGFIGTLVFNLSKVKKEHHKEVLKNIIEWNKKNLKINGIHKFKKDEMIFEKNNDVEIIKEYINWITKLEPVEYRLITKEMMSLFGWIKRFADGMIEDKAELIKGDQ
ncbi:type III-B CRISPR module-associated protein Cmr5 [Clostridium sporogenes]|uniref:type III-B CRISPR module-associated protein Cmr5 n=1 Tax=Clostridium sporogenes TaxID=1509 RepID=UPI000E159076|nr:type III-B CRISPR module-associated protein Cmr5 [Clostridium sporogenes]MDS1009252.1 type III-B CRISPR module-associated protein Cmr5 [Clostridium sporogenes]SUY62189.1 Cmr5 family CRISPR-associated protein [Clostridium sporogenes]